VQLDKIMSRPSVFAQYLTGPQIENISRWCKNILRGVQTYVVWGQKYAKYNTNINNNSKNFRSGKIVVRGLGLSPP